MSDGFQKTQLAFAFLGVARKPAGRRVEMPPATLVPSPAETDSAELWGENLIIQPLLSFVGMAGSRSVY